MTKITNFGVFVGLENGLEGLLHISELADHKVENPEEVVKVGEVIEVKVLRVDAEERKIGLSRKRVEWAEEAEAQGAGGGGRQDRPAAAVDTGELKGGVGESSGPLFKHPAHTPSRPAEAASAEQSAEAEQSSGESPGLRTGNIHDCRTPHAPREVLAVTGPHAEREEYTACKGLVASGGEVVFFATLRTPVIFGPVQRAALRLQKRAIRVDRCVWLNTITPMIIRSAMPKIPRRRLTLSVQSPLETYFARSTKPRCFPPTRNSGWRSPSAAAISRPATAWSAPICGWW